MKSTRVPHLHRRGRTATAVLAVALVAAGGGVAAAASDTADRDTAVIAASSSDTFGIAANPPTDDAASEPTDDTGDRAGSRSGATATDDGSAAGDPAAVPDDRATAHAERVRVALAEILQPLIDDATLTPEQAEAVVEALLAADGALPVDGGMPGGVPRHAGRARQRAVRGHDGSDRPGGRRARQTDGSPRPERRGDTRSRSVPSDIADDTAADAGAAVITPTTTVAGSLADEDVMSPIDDHAPGARTPDHRQAPTPDPPALPVDSPPVAEHRGLGDTALAPRPPRRTAMCLSAR